MLQTKGRVLTGLVIGLLLAGLFLAYDATRHSHSTYDVSITQYMQSWNAPGLSPFLNTVSELTNFYPAVAIWTATFLLFFWRGLRVEAFILLLAVVTFLGMEALSVFVDRPRPSPELVHVSQFLIGNSFPSGHVFGTVVFYGFLVGVAWRHLEWLPLRLLLPTIAASIVVLAGVARVYMGVHWASDVLAGLLLGTVSLIGLLWVYSRLRAGHLEVLGLQFHVTQRRSPKRNWAKFPLWPGRSTVHLPNPGFRDKLAKNHAGLRSP